MHDRDAGPVQCVGRRTEVVHAQRQQMGACPLVGAAPQFSAVVAGQREERKRAVAERHARHGVARRRVGMHERHRRAEQ